MKAAIKMADAQGMWAKGAVVVIVEFRKSQAERINWRDKSTGKAMTAPILRHTVETDRDVLVVSERVPENFDVENFKSEYAKGQKCLLSITELATERGLMTVRGELTPISG